MMRRITTIVGAGAILDFDLPEGVMKPSTRNITEAVVNLEIKKLMSDEPITIIRDVYEIMNEAKYPTEVNFEHLFHVLEMCYAYGWVWKEPTNPPRNQKVFPVFAPLIAPSRPIEVDDLRSAIQDFLLEVMDIVDSYNAPYLGDESFNSWYRSFWKEYEGQWDVFNLNYDTTIEHSLEHCEDGFEDIEGQPDFQHFNPKKLWENVNGWSTMSHLHGCIEFHDSRYRKPVYKGEIFKYDFHDLYKYPSYKIVRDHYMGSSKSWMSNQAGEQLVNSPIITGLRKNDKLNIVPFDFYHGHLYNCIMKSNALLLVGYSFGDLYVNHLIERMELINGDNKRVVLIDWWPLYADDDAIEAIKDDGDRQSFIKDMMVQRVEDDDFNHNMGYFLCRMTGKTSTYEAVASFRDYSRNAPMISKNECLMMFIGGFKAATQYKKDIYEFLNG